jgi:hypothetical protein
MHCFQCSDKWPHSKWTHPMLVWWANASMMSSCKCWLDLSGPEGSCGTRVGERLRSHQLRAAVITWAIGAGVWYLVKWSRNLVFAFSRAAVCWSLGQWKTWSISSCHALQAKHRLSILLSWVARWCSVRVQLWASLASWYCQPLVRQPKEDRTLFQSMLLNIVISQSAARKGSCHLDFLISHLWSLGAVAAVVT